MIEAPDWLLDAVASFPAEAEPDGAVGAPHHFYIGVGVALFAFVCVWPYYPAAGALLTLVGMAVGLDDVLSHAFGIWTPLDWVWQVWLHGLVDR